MKFKHICAFLGGVSVLFSMPLTSVNAADATVKASLMNTEFQTQQDSDFTTTLYIPENSNISDFQAVLNYDTSCVSLVDAKVCSTDAGTIGINEKDGKLYISFSGTENQTSKVNVVDLKFHVVDDLGDGKYNFISIDKSSENIASSNSASGQLVEHDLISTFNTLDIYQYGDADLDGGLKSRDVTYLKQYIVGIRDISDISKIYANAYMDFEDDGVTPKLNSKDAARIQQKVVKMNVNAGDRASVTFYNQDGSVYAKKSVKSGAALNNIPSVPELMGYSVSDWSLSPDKLEKVDFSKIESDTEVYAIYGEEDEKVKLFRKVKATLDDGFFPEGTYIADDFELPHKNKFDAYQMLSSDEFDGLDIIWSVGSHETDRGISIKNYVVTVPDFDYTTWVTFTANIMFNGEKYGTAEFKREIKGKIDLPSPNTFRDVLKTIPSDVPEHYRLPGYLTLESSRMSYGVQDVNNVDVQWSVIKNSDGSTADKRVLDQASNELIYLKDKSNVTLQADFVFDGNIVYTERISRTIPAKPIEEQIEYAKDYIKRFVPSVISGETYFPTTVPLYDLSVSWIPDIESGKVEIGENETVNGITYKVINVGEKAGYMERAKAYASVERNGDESFKKTGLEFDVQLAGNSSEISTDKIPDVSLYNELKNIFDNKYGNKDGKLTEEEIYDADVMEKLNYTIDLHNKGIKNISGIKYLKYYRKIDLSGNDLSGTNASLSDLASMNYLEQISLSNCGISEIPEAVFASKHLIEGIDLSYNKLKDVNFLALKDSRTNVDCAYTELKELFLQGNYISDISNLAYIDDSGETVSRIPNVNVLTLSRDTNYFEYKTGAIFGKKVLKDKGEYEYDITTPMDIRPLGLLKSVSTLWLANNYITDISPLEKCKLLATLDLSGNSIVATTKEGEDGLVPLSKLQSLVCLKLDNNAKIQTVKSLKRLIYLEILSLSNNEIGNVSNILDGLTQLTYLDLDGNNLSSFDADSFSKLTRLYLENQGYYSENNEFVRTLVQVMNLPSAGGLTELRLNGNIIDVNSVSSISVLKNLQYLSLSGNTVVDLDFLKDLTALTHLELASCNIRQNKIFESVNSTTGEKKSEEISNMGYLAGLTNLTILDISDNEEINNIEELSTLTKLGVFYANNVKLKSAMSVRSMTKLHYLSMQNSGLEDLSFLNTLNVLEFLNLSGHKTAAFDFRNLKNYDNIVALFLDSASGTEAINIGSLVNKQNLKYMSIANMYVGSVDVLPDMDSITYLGLRNTGISDFNGTYSETDGYIYPITRFSTLKYIDVSDNTNLFIKNNLEMLYDFVGDPNNKKSIILYRDNAPEGYVPGVMNPDIESVRIKDDIDFGSGGEDVLSAMKAGYPLQNSLNGYDVEWNLEDNDLYDVKDGKLYFSNTDKVDASAKLSLTMAIKELYYRENNANTKKETPVSFTASVKTTTKKEYVKDEFVKRETTSSIEKILDGWILDETKEPDLGYSEWSGWSDWSKNTVSGTDICNVETKVVDEFSNWGGWSAPATTKVTENNLRQVKTYDEPYSSSKTVYYRACTGYTGTSIVDALVRIGLPISSINTASDPVRKQIAKVNGISNYSGTPAQNTELLNKLKAGKLIERIDTITGYTTYYQHRDRSPIKITYYRFQTRTKVPTTYYFYRDLYEPVYKDVIGGMTLVVE